LKVDSYSDGQEISCFHRIQMFITMFTKAIDHITSQLANCMWNWACVSNNHSYNDCDAE